MVLRLSHDEFFRDVHFWRLYLFFLAGVDSLRVIDGKHYLFWLRNVDFRGQWNDWYRYESNVGPRQPSVQYLQIILPVTLMAPTVGVVVAEI